MGSKWEFHEIKRLSQNSRLFSISHSPFSRVKQNAIVGVRRVQGHSIHKLEPYEDPKKSEIFRLMRTSSLIAISDSFQIRVSHSSTARDVTDQGDTFRRTFKTL